MFFAKVLVILVLALILIAEAQPRREDKAGSGRPRPLPDHYRRDRQKGRGRRKGGFMKKFFDDSCLPTDCNEKKMFGFSNSTPLYRVADFHLLHFVCWNIACDRR